MKEPALSLPRWPGPRLSCGETGQHPCKWPLANPVRAARRSGIELFIKDMSNGHGRHASYEQ